MLRSLSTDTITHTTNQPDKETTKPTLFHYQNILTFNITHINSYATLIRSRDQFGCIILVVTHCVMFMILSYNLYLYTVIDVIVKDKCTVMYRALCQGLYKP